MNRLYYTIFYAVNALLVKNEIYAQTHSEVKNQFSTTLYKNWTVIKTCSFFL